METVTLIAAIIAAGAALLNSAVTVLGQSRLEREKWRQSRKDELDNARRMAIAELAKQLACCAQAMAWLMWKAVHDPRNLNAGDITTYNADIKQLLPGVMSAHLMAVAVDPPIDEVAKELVHNVYELDHAISLACTTFGDAPLDCTAQLARTYPLAVEYLDTLHSRLAGIIGAGK